MKRTTLALSLLCSLCTGCLDLGALLPEREFDVCGETMLRSEVAALLDANRHAHARVSWDGESRIQLESDLILSLATHGVELATLARPNFEDGHYSLGVIGAVLDFEVTFAEDFGEYAAGDVVPYDLWDLSSYAVNVRTELDTSEFPPVVRTVADPGPLADLVEGPIAFDAFSFTASLRTELLAIETDTSRTDEDTRLDGDAMTVHMASPRVNVGEMAVDLDDVGLAFSVEGSSYASPDEGIFWALDASTLHGWRHEGEMRWEGEYEARFKTDRGTFFLSGFATNGGGAHTEFFCDAERTQPLGVAEHAADLGRGVFEFAEGGWLVEY